MRHTFLGTGDPGWNPVRKLLRSPPACAMRSSTTQAWPTRLALSVPVLVAAFFLRERVDFLLIVAVTGFVLVAEIFNSALEALCDFVESRHNEKIRVIKDIAAAGAGIAILVWILVLGTEIAEMLLAPA